ncbi:MAG: bifunctional phosphopantothenoylcysteine decarboxylase/phosphopantothenate--cysteine ligase CoaBC [Flavobacteriales bacterium]|nr:bifunctional phosphopantothenoylcysteine decarboxylase/phosphopantothenate--cysteine ligase CoaBC [Flavobacteriales bacterium]
MLNNKNVLLGISASIAAYKAANLVRLLKKAGAKVKIIQTPKSLDFVTPLTLSTLSGNAVLTEMVDNNDKTWNNHVNLGMWADIMLIAPATAKTLSKMANGDCDNILIATYLSANCPVYFAPAMDLDMYQHKSTHDNIKKLEDLSNILIPPSYGELASGLVGQGRMEEPEEIIRFINDDIKKKSPLFGIKLLITAGPTHEKIDKVRYISNYSSGKMGIALARVGANLGADVTLVLGPTIEKIEHPNIEIIDVVSAKDMFNAVIDIFDKIDIGIFAAAVSDFRPKQQKSNKIKKEENIKEINLERTTDILLEISKSKNKSQYIVGFALETDNELNNAIRKLKNKKLDLIVLNSLNDKNSGFMFDTNKITLIDSKDNIEAFKNKSKHEVAIDIFNKIINTRK